MNCQLLGLVLLTIVALTACGGEPEQVVMDRRFASVEEQTAQVESIRNAVNGEILGEYEWYVGEDKVFTLLTHEDNAADKHAGIYLRQYKLSGPSPELLWTYQDTIACSVNKGALNAGAVEVVDRSPVLRPLSLTASGHQQFILNYTLICPEATARSLVVVDARSGTPDIRLSGDASGLTEAADLVGLPEDTVQRLLAIW